MHLRLSLLLSLAACTAERADVDVVAAASAADTAACPRAAISASFSWLRFTKSVRDASVVLDGTHTISLPASLDGTFVNSAAYSATLGLYDPIDSEGATGNIRCNYATSTTGRWVLAGCSIQTWSGSWVTLPVAAGARMRTQLVTLAVRAPFGGAASATANLVEPLEDGDTCTDDACVIGNGATHVLEPVCELDPGEPCDPFAPNECELGRCSRIDRTCHVGCACDDVASGCDDIAKYRAYTRESTFFCGIGAAVCTRDTDCCGDYVCVRPNPTELGYCHEGGSGHPICE